MHHQQNHKGAHSHHGTIRDVFGHRFVLSTEDGPVLADVGPHAPEAVRLTCGAQVMITGEQTPSEIKVHLFQSGSGETIKIPHKSKKKQPQEGDRDSEIAVQAAFDAGYTVQGEPKRKPKHFVLHAIRGGHHYELHIMLNGDIRKEIPLHK
jgi:hypothetical protein